MSKKLYVLVDERLSMGQKLAQSCHAVANFMLQAPTEWLNETIVILNAPIYIIEEAIHQGGHGYQDTYYKEPRVAAFTNLPQLDIRELELVR